jgi:hypothetical protein
VARLPVAFPSHANAQWVANTTLLIYRCGGSVGFAPTSRLTSRVDWTQKRGAIIGTELNKATANPITGEFEIVCLQIVTIKNQ